MSGVRLIAIVAIGVWAWAVAVHARAEEPPLIVDEKRAIAISQAVVGQVVRDGRFVRIDGRKIDLAQFRGKPVVVNLIYTGCNQACPVIIETLRRNVEIGQDALGRDAFAVITVGFDTRRDTPERMRAFARERGAILPNWHFLSTDYETANRLAKDTGFVFRASAGGFAHATQTTIIDAEGKVYRQIYGGGFEPPALVEPLKDLILGRKGNLTSLSGLINRIKFFCTVYSPAVDRYRFDYGIFVAFFIGLACLGGVAVVLVRAGWRAHASRRSA